MKGRHYLDGGGGMPSDATPPFNGFTVVLASALSLACRENQYTCVNSPT